MSMDELQIGAGSPTLEKTLADELFEAASTVGKIPQTGRTRDEVLRDLVRWLESVPDTTFYKLSPHAQAWYNEAVHSFNVQAGYKAGGAVPPPIPPLPGYDKDAPMPEIPKEEAEVVALPVAQSPKTTGTAGPPRDLPKSPSEYAREVVIQNPDFSEAQVREALIKVLQDNKIAGAKATENLVYTIRFYTQAAMKTARRLGWRPPE